MLKSISDTFRKLGHCPITSHNCSSVKIMTLNGKSTYVKNKI